MKIAPLIRELQKRNIGYDLVHTGQHYDENMSEVFLKELGIFNDSIIFLEIDKNIDSLLRISKIHEEFEKVLLRNDYSCVIVVGDVDSTYACALTAKKIGPRIVHVEAGLRSFNLEMPEEYNRILVDKLSDILFTTEKSARKNLKAEGISKNKIFFVGNVMIDNLIYNLSQMKNPFFFKGLGNYGLITLHRPSNVDNKEKFENILKIFEEVAKRNSLFFIIHPRTEARIDEFNFNHYLTPIKNINPYPSSGPLEFIRLMIEAKFILTDSGGIQEEASYLRVPILTMREETERPITVERGTNTIVGADQEKIISNLQEIFNGKYKKGKSIKYWDGKTSERIVDILIKKKFIEV
jgi:UDP-N-acetylglucosamine 2-epimerase (non-hydrolysing)